MTRYLSVRETLAQEIVEGRYRVGERFPTDQQLCARFSVSRHTVREALRDLQQDGVIARQRGAGTVVAAPMPPYVQAVASLDELDSYAAETRFECVSESVIVAREQMARDLDCPARSRWLRFAGFRYRLGDGDPLCWTEVLLAEALIPHRGGLRQGTGPFYERVRRIAGLSAEVVEQRISAIAIGKDQAELLNADQGGPALLVRRRYLTPDQTPFEISLSIHPGDRYVSSTRLTKRRSPLPPA